MLRARAPHLAASPARRGCSLFLMLLLLAGAGPAAAADAPLFSDDFETPGLPMWTGKSRPPFAAQDPLRPTNHVLGFSGLDADSDVVSVAVPVVRGAQYLLHFEHLGRYDLKPEGGQEINVGGAIGFTDGTNQRWLAGTSPGMAGIPTDNRLVDDGVWHTYDIVFDPYASFSPAGDSIHLVLEKLVTSQAVPGDPFFDNVRLTRQGGGSSSGGGCSYSPNGSGGGIAFALSALALLRRRLAR
jgi:hypothetical protein